MKTVLEREAGPGDQGIAMHAPDRTTHPTIEQIATVLGGAALRQRITSADHLAQLVRRGLPVRTIHRVARLVGRSQAERHQVVTVVAPSAILNRRARHLQPLSVEGSRRIVRIARLVALAEMVLGSHDEAVAFLFRPHALLGSRVPIDSARTERETRSVESLLRRLEWRLPE